MNSLRYGMNYWAVEPGTRSASVHRQAVGIWISVRVLKTESLNQVIKNLAAVRGALSFMMKLMGGNAFTRAVVQVTVNGIPDA